MRKLLALGALVLPLDGCVAIWGQAYHVELETPVSVTVKYDDNFGSLAEAQAAAAASCGRSGRQAVQSGAPRTSLWGLSTVDFDCIDKG